MYCMNFNISNIVLVIFPPYLSIINGVLTQKSHPVLVTFCADKQATSASHYHLQFKVIYYSMLAWVRLFITIVFLRFSLSCARLRVTHSSRKSKVITCSQVFLGLPGPLLPLTSSVIHFFTQLSLSILTTWPNQRNRLR